MIFDNILVYYISFLVCVKFAVADVTRKTSSNSDETVKHTFAKLLNSIVSVNEERMNAVKKINQLQDYLLKRKKLRPDDDSYDSVEEGENHIFLALEDSVNLRRTEDEILSRLWTNQAFKQACYSLSSDFCINACMKTFRNVCDRFKCDSIAKKDFRRDFRTDCEANCRNIFEREEG